MLSKYAASQEMRDAVGGINFATLKAPCKAPKAIMIRTVRTKSTLRDTRERRPKSFNKLITNQKSLRAVNASSAVFALNTLNV